MAAHSKIGASSMERWSNCPASVRLSAGIESVSSVYAEEGTRAHDVGANILEMKPITEPVPQEMLEAVMVYVQEVQAAVEAAGAGAMLLVEHRFDLSSVHPGLFGTCDAIVYDPERRLLRVIDYKHGMGIPVEVFEDGKPNLQLLYYGLGAILEIKKPVAEVELVIVQPRCAHPDGPVRRHRFQSYELIDFAADLVEAAKRTEDPNAPIVSGEWCRFCPAAPQCPELHKNALEVASREFSPAFSYDPVKLSETLHKLPMLEAFIKNIREFAYREAEHGRLPPGFKLVPKRATRKWKDETEVQAACATLVSPDALFDRKLRSPAAIEKELGKKVFASELGHLVVQESSGCTLAPESDKRNSVLLDAAEAFKNV